MNFLSLQSTDCSSQWLNSLSGATQNLPLWWRRPTWKRIIKVHISTPGAQSRLLQFHLIYLFMTVLGLHCCTRAFSSCGVPASHCSGFSCFRAQARGMQASVAAAPRLWSTGSVVVAQGLIARRHVGSSWIGNQTHVSCIGRWMVDSLPLDHQRKPYNSILIGRLKK